MSSHSCWFAWMQSANAHTRSERARKSASALSRLSAADRTSVHSTRRRNGDGRPMVQIDEHPWRVPPAHNSAARCGTPDSPFITSRSASPASQAAHTRLPQAWQYRPPGRRPSSQTGHREDGAHVPRSSLRDAEGSRISNAAIIVIVVPVAYSALMDRAHSITPVRSSHWPMAKKLARSRIVAASTMTISLRILMVMITPAFPCIWAQRRS